MHQPLAVAPFNAIVTPETCAALPAFIKPGNCHWPFISCSHTDGTQRPRLVGGGFHGHDYDPLPEDRPGNLHGQIR